MEWTTLTEVQRLPRRALAALLRRLVLPIEILLQEGPYRPFVAEFSRACDAAEPWYALGQKPERVGRLGLDAVEMRGSREEQQMWGTLWSASRAMEFARTGQVEAAREQFQHTLELIRDWEPEHTLGEASRTLRRQASESIAHLAEILPNAGDPPLDGDGLAVPVFYLSKPDPPNPSETDAYDLSFDRELEKLAHLLMAGHVAVFCGAGISIDSGLPSADDLRAALLELLPASEREVDWLRHYGMPFEEFLEAIHNHVALGPIRDLFAEGEPSAGHRFVADLASLGYLQTIATTNFDELIEKALRDGRVPYRVAWRPEDLTVAARDEGSVSVVKLHGTVSDPDSLALVLERVAGRRHVPAREEAIRTLFAHGSHKAVLVLGYSCSDQFDITPAIESLGGSLKCVYFVQHETSFDWHAGTVKGRLRKNPFRESREGVRLICHTTRLLERLYEGMTGRALPPSGETRTDGNWRTFVQRWWRQIPEAERSFVGHNILGNLWYRCGDYRAAKAHFRAALSMTAPRFVTPYGDPMLYEGLILERPSVPGEVRCQALLQVGGCHRALSEYRDAMRRFDEAAGLARSCGDQALEAAASGSAGTVLFNTGNFGEAVLRHQHSAAIWERLGDRPRELGTCLANLGNVYGASGQLEEALACFRRGVEIAREIGDKVGEGSRLGGLGVVQSRLGQWPEAEASHLAALGIAVALDDRSGMAHQFGGLATVKTARGDLQGGIADARKAIALFEELGDRQGLARALGNLGQYCLAGGVVGLGLESLVRSLEMAAAIGDASVLANAIRGLQMVIESCLVTEATRMDIKRAKALLEAAHESGEAPDIRALEAVIGRLVPFLGS